MAAGSSALRKKAVKFAGLMDRVTVDGNELAAPAAALPQATLILECFS